ncbi:MAG: hypothetical protein CTY31_03625 [Hyphomicrobium sp.]|nr:MAG: hypothetical protein CTY39_12120 [Hyphomicrobium sp.]PPD01832.1 MAG: hypothetical protein CTY31_03625 [Hyphomicrobium sp.]
MMKHITATVIAMSLMAPAASALTITNKTSKDHTIGVDLGDKERVEKIAAGKTLKLNDCKDGCGLTGPWAFSWMAKTGEDFAFDDKGIVAAGS